MEIISTLIINRVDLLESNKKSAITITLSDIRHLRENNVAVEEIYQLIIFRDNDGQTKVLKHRSGDIGIVTKN